MEFKKILAFAAIVFGIGTLEFMRKQAYISIVFITIILIYLLSTIYESIRWVKNNRTLDYDYIKLSGGINFGDLASLAIVLFPLLSDLTGSGFSIFKEFNSVMNSESFSEYISKFSGNEKFFLYAMICIFTFAVINIIKGIFIIPKVCSGGFLDTNGKNIPFNEISRINIKKTIFGLSRSIAVARDKESKVFYIANRSYDDFMNIIRLYFPNEVIGDIERNGVLSEVNYDEI